MPDDAPQTKRQKPITLGKLLILFVLLAGGIVFIWNQYGFGSITDGTPSITPSPAPTTTAQPTFGTSGSDEDIVEVVISAENYSFTPSTVSVQQGDKVRLVLESTEGTHDITIDELGISTQLVSDGHMAWVDFTADTAGEFTFYCSVSDHRALGMEGTFIVE